MYVFVIVLKRNVSITLFRVFIKFLKKAVINIQLSKQLITTSKIATQTIFYIKCFQTFLKTHVVDRIYHL